MTQDKPYSLSKSQQTLNDAIKRYKRLKARLSHKDSEEFEKDIEALHNSIAAKNQVESSILAKKLRIFLKTIGKKTFFDHTLELVCALIIAIAIAACTRQMWFELYEIPTGSMRPTFREQDRVLVVKNAYGLNVPFETAHFTFQPKLISRGRIIVFTGDKLDIPDVDTTYFGVFPGKRRYVKRCMAKPLDTIYFYGGRIYAIDASGTNVSPFTTSSEVASLEHIPFVSFDGKVATTDNAKLHERTYTIHYMNIPVAAITATGRGISSKLIYEPLKNLPDTPLYKILGIENFAEARLLYKEELPQDALSLGYVDDASNLYLELKHHPILPTSKNIPTSTRAQDASLLSAALTWLPLNKEAITKIANSLYTSRFVVKNGMAYCYQSETPSDGRSGIYMNKAIPDGTYEFFNGIAYKIGFGGLSSKLDQNHPIYPKTTDAIKVLFNSGIELMDITNNTSNRGIFLFPSRYAYFRDGDFIVMNHTLFDKASPTVQQFNTNEENRHNRIASYCPFIDMGSPITSGIIDTTRISQYGMKLPEKNYLALGDNYARSLDGRYFGYVPEDNLQGSPFFLFWPPGHRAGFIEPESPFFRIENLYVFLGVVFVGSLTFVYFIRSTSIMRYRKLKKTSRK